MPLLSLCIAAPLVSWGLLQAALVCLLVLLGPAAMAIGIGLWLSGAAAAVSWHGEGDQAGCYCRLQCDTLQSCWCSECTAGKVHWESMSVRLVVAESTVRHDIMIGACLRMHARECMLKNAWLVHARQCMIGTVSRMHARECIVGACLRIQA